jgi:hypothetical protein
MRNYYYFPIDLSLNNYNLLHVVLVSPTLPLISLLYECFVARATIKQRYCTRQDY